MSRYNNYDVTSSTYDDSRRSFGSDVIAGLIYVHKTKPLHELHVLDAGCGTGNYSKDLLQMGVGHMTMLDASEGMLNKARVKVEPFKDKVTIQQGLLPDLPFADGTFDVVMFNFVLHHLVSEDSEDPFQQMTLTFKEAYRVLAPGGLMVLGTVLPEQNRESCWYAKLVPALTERSGKKLAAMTNLKKMFTESKLSFKRAVTVLGSDWFEQYRDLEGPLKPEWRSNNSYWTLATADEIREVEEKVKQLIKDGKLEDFFREQDKTDVFGLFTFLFAVKQ